MKRFVFISLLSVLFAFSSTAQEQPMWVGGTLNVSSETVNDNTTSRTTIMPEFGYHLNDNWAVGGRMGFSFARQDMADGTEKNNTFSIVPFARYTFAQVKKFRIFGQGELPLRFHSGEFADGSSMDNTNAIGLNVRPGLTYAFNDKWGFNMLMPPVFSFVSGDDYSAVEFGVNDGYTLQNYLLNTSIGFIYKF